MCFCNIKTKHLYFYLSNVAICAGSSTRNQPLLFQDIYQQLPHYFFPNNSHPPILPFFLRTSLHTIPGYYTPNNPRRYLRLALVPVPVPVPVTLFVGKFWRANTYVGKMENGTYKKIAIGRYEDTHNTLEI